MLRRAAGRGTRGRLVNVESLLPGSGPDPVTVLLLNYNRGGSVGEVGGRLTVQDNNSRLEFHRFRVGGTLQSEQAPPVLQALHLNGFPGRLVGLVSQLTAHGSLLQSRWKEKDRPQYRIRCAECIQLCDSLETG